MAQYFGLPAQQLMQHRADALWTLLRADRRIQCHGRLLSVSFDTQDCVDLVMALAHLQGSAGFENVPDDAVRLVQTPLHKAGFRTDTGEEWRAGADALRAADRAIAKAPLPEGLALRQVDADTSPKTLAALDRLCQAGGEWMPMERFLRGDGHPAVFLYLMDTDDRPIAFGGGVMHANRYHPNEDEGFWGFLAVHRDWAGKRLSLTLGAHVMRQMRVQLGTENFSTIVRPEQEGFKALCRQLGFSPARQSAIYVQDPSAFAGLG